METIKSVRPLQVRVSQRTTWTFVEISTSDGRIGTGEASVPFGQDSVVRHLRRLAGDLIGEVASRKPAALAPASAVELPQVAANSALDEALFDLAAQRLDRPISAMLSEVQRRDIPAYANINRRTSNRTPDGFAASAAAAAKAGMTAIKIAPFDRIRPEMSADEALPLLAIAFDRIAAVRDAIGRECELLVDCHWRLNASMAEDLLRIAAANRLFWIETPFAEDASRFADIRRLRSRANALGIRVAGGELKVDLAGFAPLIDGDLYDVVMPDMTFVGGYEAFMRVAEAANSRGMAVSPHNPTGPICHAHSVQASAAAPNILHLETQFDETPCFTRIVEGLLPVAIAGCIAVPRPAGLGLRLGRIEPEAAAQRVQC